MGIISLTGIASLARPAPKSYAALENIISPIEKPVTTTSSTVIFFCGCCDNNHDGLWDLDIKKIDKVLNKVLP